jgi:hypothetical protein
VNHWPFIIAAYAITALGTFVLSWTSWRAMRDAESRASSVKRD